MIKELSSMIDLENLELTGQHTPDPLRYAFKRKGGAHSGSAARPIAKEETQSRLTQALGESVDKRSPRCLYIHIPFCRVRCTYCNFFQYASSTKLMDAYFEALKTEIKRKSAEAWTQSAPFHAVYVGGGTPTDLSGAQLQQLGQMIHQHFPLTPDCEVTLEGRINRFGEDKFESALEGGFSRFSFGIQSFNTQVRRAAKRLDDGDVALERIQNMVAYNSAPVVIDLLFGLPHQTLDIWQKDLELYLESGADGVDLYQLIDMKGLPMQQMVEQGKLPAPANTATKATMFEMGVNFMAKRYQRRLSCNHWARGNRERSIYNSLAKTTAEVLPIGAGAGGNVSGLQMMQTRNMEDYIQAIEADQYPVAMLMLADANREITSCIRAAFDRGVLSKQVLNHTAGWDIYSAAMPLFEKWQTNGLVKVDGDYIALTLAGEFWNVNLAQNLINTASSLNQSHIAA
ncbi:heme anaerobic degradation radical SAM methyltransferase ChuW/HutW [Vibrio astriarenae]|uniref:Heme anaerobic degradation radical SAM methyltransferase ChuW/HutW n=1 Tax=Vibrio astriarenae TaxID=1481923 RepID=A0A7Z2T3H9_9VIBR|nr:heme anaerobic degradation radical SAM methyltransferase ChuW/HutW [Vibrio astriarenae]QIA63696.1 heme anaerobic degradation radical SAM methyltransferase ChuW/HutW [Vibrio astriarenae]